METHYHSQFDNDGFYDEQVYRLHHELFALLILALDETAVVPLCFAPVLRRSAAAVTDIEDKISSDFYLLCSQAVVKAGQEYDKIKKYNSTYSRLLREGREAEAEQLFQETRELERSTLAKFKTEQDAFVRMDWYGNVFYPHELLQENIKLLKGTMRNLHEGNLSAGLRKLYQVDNNAYAFMFDEEVYRHFTDYVFDQPANRLKWGYQRLLQHEDFYFVVKDLLKKQKEQDTDFTKESKCLEEICEKQKKLLTQTYRELTKIVTGHFL